MGRLSIYRKTIGALAILASIGFMSSNLPLQNTRTASAQTRPAIYLTAGGARDANTFQSDKALDAACRKSGQSQSVCLCVTHVMKFEMPIKSYRAASRLYGQPADRASLYKKLAREGYGKTDITLAEQMEQSLIRDADFALRCADAKAYYRQQSK